MSQTPSRFATLMLGEIATNLPGATAVFRRHKLDFCCGGRISLQAAAEREGLDLAAIEAELAALGPDSAPAPEDPAQLVDSIVARFHDVHRRELPELILLAERVERVHAGRPETPVGLSRLLAAIHEELEGHMRKEELVLFPMMRNGGHPMIASPIAMMRHEHDGHGEQLRALTELAHDFVAPADACGTWRALYLGLRKFSDDLMEHIHTENNILFTHFGG